jgi:hypothetical protein
MSSKIAYEGIDVQITKDWYTYLLRYPKDYGELSDIVFYIGKGTRNRVFDHLHEARKGQGTKNACIIRDVWAQGKQIQVEIPLQSDDPSDALQYEWACLCHIHASKHLTNFKDAAHIRDRDVSTNDLWVESLEWSEVPTEETLSVGFIYEPEFREPVIDPNLPEPIKAWEERIYETSSFSSRVPERMPAKIEGDTEVYFNLKTACNFTGVGRQGLRFIDLSVEFGLSTFRGRVVTYYAKSELLRFIDWVNEKYPGESINPNFAEPETPYGKQRNLRNYYHQ